MEKDIIKTCVQCDKAFRTIYYLKTHTQKFHPEQVDRIVDLFPKKNYKYKCKQCPRNFSLLKNFNYHMKTHRGENINNDVSSSNRTMSISQCPICKSATRKENLITHFKIEHNINCVTKTMEFNSFEEFSEWKLEKEHETKTKYIMERGFKVNKQGTRTATYRCHRSGKYVTKGKGLRHLKTQGSNKISGFCPAHLKIIIDKNKQCKVNFMDQHVGHETDLRHLFLTSQERKSLANKMALKMPFSKILNEIRDSAEGSNLQRIHLLSRKDLNNIEKSFHLESTVNIISEDPNWPEVSGIITGLTINQVSLNGIDVDSNQLSRKKQELIRDFTQLIETAVSSMEQFNVANKMYTSLGPALEAVAIKQTKKNMCTLPFIKSE